MIAHLDLGRINALCLEELQAAVAAVTASGRYLLGEATARFERQYADYIGTSHCVGCANGLDALTLIFRAYKEMGLMQEGDEVIVPANTYIATILAITENRLMPVLVEPSLDTLQIDDALIERAITPRTKAVLIVHLYGRCAYTPLIGELCQRHGLRLVEDNAQAHGCLFQGKRTGSLSHAAAHSFYPTKNLGALGDAGAVTTDDEELASLLRSLSNYGSSRRYVFDHAGRNSRIDELQAAVLSVKLPYLDQWNNQRKQIASTYIDKVDNPLVNIPQSPRDSVYHLFPILSPRRDSLKAYLAQHGVQTDIHYPIPPHKQQCYSQWAHMQLPRTELIHQQELSLPCNPAMTTEEACHVASLINSYQ